MATKWLDASLKDYTIHRIAKDETGEDTGVLYNYYLYIHPKGQAIIMREKIDETEYLYANAEKSESKWSNRQDLTYDTYDKLFVK